MDCVDLDKVLDDFEELEDHDHCSPNSGPKASPAKSMSLQQDFDGYPHPTSIATHNTTTSYPDGNAMPEKFDITEAEFGPSTRTHMPERDSVKGTGAGGYFVPESDVTQVGGMDGFRKIVHMEAMSELGMPSLMMLPNGAPQGDTNSVLAHGTKHSDTITSPTSADPGGGNMDYFSLPNLSESAMNNSQYHSLGTINHESVEPELLQNVAMKADQLNNSYVVQNNHDVSDPVLSIENSNISIAPSCTSTPDVVPYSSTSVLDVVAEAQAISQEISGDSSESSLSLTQTVMNGDTSSHQRSYSTASTASPVHDVDEMINVIPLDLTHEHPSVQMPLKQDGSDASILHSTRPETTESPVNINDEVFDVSSMEAATEETLEQKEVEICNGEISTTAPEPTMAAVGFGAINDVEIDDDELLDLLNADSQKGETSQKLAAPTGIDTVTVGQEASNEETLDLAPESVTTDIPAENVAESGSVATTGTLQARRVSNESMEKFLANTSVLSSSANTPIIDGTSFSTVPGYGSNLAESVEVSIGVDNGCSADLAISPVHNVQTTYGDSVMTCEREGSKERNNVIDGTGPVILVRPKELTATTPGRKTSRPNSLLGLSRPELPVPCPVDAAAEINAPTAAESQAAKSPQQLNTNTNDLINMQLAQRNKSMLTKKQLNIEIKHQISSGAVDNRILDNLGPEAVGTVTSVPGMPCPAEASSGAQMNTEGSSLAAEGSTDTDLSVSPSATSRPSRPTSLNLMSGAPASQGSQSASASETEAADGESEVLDAASITDNNEASGDIEGEAQTQHLNEPEYVYDTPENTEVSYPVSPHPAAGTRLQAPPLSSNINIAITELGKVAPQWVPDAEASNCMQCEARFTFTKRRHHCRACGKLFCSGCCNLRTKLPHMDSKEARVCSKCYQDLIRAQVYERMHTTSSSQPSPNPNNPSEYCSTVSPLQQATASAPLPSVMVPVGVLRKEGGLRRGEAKQVVFSDGIRPGGDLTELDGSEARMPTHRSGRKSKKVEKPAERSAAAKNNAVTLSEPDRSSSICLIPSKGLPPVILSTGVKGDFTIEDYPSPEKIMPQVRDLENPNPVVFAINKNLFVLVKIVNLDCCVNRVCWCFTTKGMCTVGQDEIVIVLECLPDEKTIPRDIFCHFNTVYQEAGKGNTVSHFGHTIFAQGFLDSKDHGGFLYIRPSFQCVQKLLLPPQPYILGILLQKWETPWAKVFPIRLMLRLGAEYRYYPCPLISVRFRKPVFGEIGHTIMNLLADFHKFQYMLPQARGVSIHMEDKKTYISFPRNRYDDVMKVIHNSNDHVMALGANFSMEADSHLVCIQTEDGSYQTQAINIQNKSRRVTGASFVVFNGALKGSSGLRAKSSIVEDGLMVQITAESMVQLKQAMKSMEDFSIGCGSLDAPQPEEWVNVQWVEDDKNINVGVKSPLDNMAMDGIESVHIHSSTDYFGENRTIRWTEVFFIENEETGSVVSCEPVDLSRLAETLAQATCIALAPHLDKLKELNSTKIALRATIDPERVCYEAGACGARLPHFVMDHLDTHLIPVIHSAATQNQVGPVVLELIFHIIE